MRFVLDGVTIEITPVAHDDSAIHAPSLEQAINTIAHIAMRQMPMSDDQLVSLAEYGITLSPDDLSMDAADALITIMERNRAKQEAESQEQRPEKHRKRA